MRPAPNQNLGTLSEARRQVGPHLLRQFQVETTPNAPRLPSGPSTVGSHACQTQCACFLVAPARNVPSTGVRPPNRAATTATHHQFRTLQCFAAPSPYPVGVCDTQTRGIRHEYSVVSILHLLFSITIILIYFLSSLCFSLLHPASLPPRPRSEEGTPPVLKWSPPSLSDATLGASRT